jgi:hypothetical protein
MKILQALFLLPLRAWRWWWGFVWDLSEMTCIPLGRFALWVFGQMIGATSWRRIDKPQPPAPGSEGEGEGEHERHRPQTDLADHRRPSPPCGKESR